MNTEHYDFFAPCPRGMAYLLANELKSLGFAPEALRETAGGIQGRAAQVDLLRACLWSRLANRMLLRLAHGELESGDELYDFAAQIDWTELFDGQKTFAISVTGDQFLFKNSQFPALRVKDALVDQFRTKHGSRPSVDSQNPDILIQIYLNKHKIEIYLDLAKESLHKRGYRHSNTFAPLKENLAAALLTRAGWQAMAQEGGVLVDPMCGSGTLLIEGALMAADCAPNLTRKNWGFLAWDEFRPHLWRELQQEAIERREVGWQQLSSARFLGADQNPTAVRAAQYNAAQAGLTGKIQWQHADATQLIAPATLRQNVPQLLITNPPYGERLSQNWDIVRLYSQLGAHWKRHYAGWQVAWFSAVGESARLGLKPSKKYAFYNGALACELLLIPIVSQENSSHIPENQDIHPQENRENNSQNANHLGQDLYNRLKKNHDKKDKWRKTKNINAYRLYDADLPDYAAAIDVYHCQEQTHIMIQEYAPPKSIPEAVAEKRLRIIFAETQRLFNLPSNQFHYRVRRAQKGKQQYEKLAENPRFYTIIEKNCKLKVNFDNYLDTGLFLDHRPIREKIQLESNNKKFLNLFCYTGSATAHAIVGGARETVSVDMSNTYLDWAEANIHANIHGKNARAHRLIRADVLAWLDAEDVQESYADYFDVIFCDPPTFSNSKKMEDTWDIQRDHVLLLENVVNLLAPNGVLYFSTNRRGFILDQEFIDQNSDQFEIKNITKQSIDMDFDDKIHQCWAIRRL